MRKNISKIIVFFLSFFIVNLFLCAAQDDPLKELGDFRKRTEECQRISDPKKAPECIYKVQNDLQSWMKETEKELQQKLETLSQEKISLKRQIEYLDSQIAYNNLKIRYTQDQINLLRFDIEATKKHIEETEKRIQNLDEKIKETKKTLSLSLRDFYTSDQGKEILKVLFEKASLADVFFLKTYYEKFQQKIENLLSKLEKEKRDQQKIKEDLLKQKRDLERKKEDLEQYKVSLEDIKQKLAYDKRQKEVLLEITKGDEKKFQEIMENIKKQAENLLSGLRDFAATLNIKKLGNWARFEVPLFYQTDPRWANLFLGPSPYTVGKYGCAVASVAMVFSYYGKNVTPATLAQDYQIFACSGKTGDFCWNNVSHYGMRVSTLVGHTFPNEINLDNYFQPGRPMVVFVSRGDKKYRGHYVVVTGKVNNKYVVNDPILGTVYLEDTKKMIHDYVLAEYKIEQQPIVDEIIIYTPVS